MTDQPEPLSAYDLLSKPTISLTDAEVKLIVEDLRTRPLVCWALVEDDTGTRVVGLDADHVAGTGDASRFVGYARVGESLARFK